MLIYFQWVFIGFQWFLIGLFVGWVLNVFLVHSIGNI